MLRCTLLALVAVCFSATSFTNALPDIWKWFLNRATAPKPRNPLPRDCIWASWYNVSPCMKIDKNLYIIKQRRDNVPPINGGQECIDEESEQVSSCDELQYMASTFLASIRATSSSKSSFSKPLPFLPSLSFSPTMHNFKPIKPRRCNYTHTDKNGMARILGVQCKSRRRRRRKRQVSLADIDEILAEKELYSLKHRDVLFLIDESGSIGELNFKYKFLRMARVLTKAFCGTIKVHPQKTRVGVMSFDLKQHVHLNFNDLFDKIDISNFMSTRIPYSSDTHGGTCLVNALNYTRVNMTITDRGARINIPNTERLVIMLTDACANCISDEDELKEKLVEMREKFEEEKIAFITFFVGQNTKCAERLVSLADGSLCHQVFIAANWIEFDKIVKSIEEAGCINSWVIGKPCEE